MQYPHKAKAQDVAASVGPGVQPRCESPLLAALNKAMASARPSAPGSARHKASDPAGYAAWLNARGEVDLPEWTRPEGQRVRPKAEGGSPLGSKRQFVDIASPKAKGRKAPERQDQKTKQKKKLTPEQLAERRKLEMRERYADQRHASQLMWAHSTDGKPKGVTLCGWTLQTTADGPVDHVDVMRETLPDRPAKGFLTGLQKCKLGWVCPVCTIAKAEESRQKLNAILSRGRREGWQMVMVTLTTRHDEDMPFSWLWKRLSAASDELRRTYAWKQLNKGLVGSAKAVEATHGASGWHPHYHVVLVFKSGMTEAEAIEQAEALRAEWLTQLGAQGLTGNDHAFQVQGAAAAGNYLAKWGAAEEMSLGHAKQGRAGQRTPWQLLRDSRGGDGQAGELWHEFVAGIKGTHQIRLTPGLRDLVKEELEYLADEKAKAIEAGKCPPEPEPKQVSMGQITPDEWMARGRHRRVMIMEGAALRTRREAERAVWAARQGWETDADVLNQSLIEGDDPPDRPDDDPEALIAKHRAEKRRADRQRLREMNEAADEIERLENVDN